MTYLNPRERRALRQLNSLGTGIQILGARELEENGGEKYKINTLGGNAMWCECSDVRCSRELTITVDAWRDIKKNHPGAFVQHSKCRAEPLPGDTVILEHANYRVVRGETA